MRFTFSHLLFLLSALVMLTVAAPVPEVESVGTASSVESVEIVDDLEKRGSYSGKGTWYRAGLGACGKWNNDGDKIVALPPSRKRHRHGYAYLTLRCVLRIQWKVW